LDIEKGRPDGAAFLFVGGGLVFLACGEAGTA
jgi:hypothetical protein